MGENIFSKSITVLVLVSTFIAQHTLGQVNDNFTDGDFSQAPVWSGSVLNFAVNGSHQLQLNAPGAGSSVLTTPFTIPSGHNTQWEFFISHTFASSAANNSRVYLMSNSDVLTGSLNGYYLQFGEDLGLDAVELFKQNGNSRTSVIRGPNGDVASANFTVRVKVTRSSIGEWQLFIDKLGGTNFTPTATVIDNTFTTSNFFGVRCLYTVGNITNFFFDDFSVTTEQAPDIFPPQIDSVTAITPTQLRLIFSETLLAAALNPSDFVLNDTLEASAASYVKHDSSILLAFNSPMKNGHMQKINYPNVSDVAGNQLSSSHYDFLYFKPVAPNSNDIIITEVYPDPSPSIGLPPYEFIEIYNQSEHPFQLENWQITDGSTNGILQSRILLPKEYLILIPNEAVSSYLPFGNTMGLLHFPSLNNSGDNVRLKSPDGLVIDSLSYSVAAYRDDDKNAGGYTLERIDPTNFCSGINNWRAGDNLIGGTPGTQNSIHLITPDDIGPKLLNVIPKSANTITLKFDERLSTIPPPLESFAFPYDNEKISAMFSDEAKKEIDLRLSTDLDSTLQYTITVSQIFDCPGNELQNEFGTASFKMDMTKPLVLSITTESQSRTQIQFSEKIDGASIDERSVIVSEYEGSRSVSLSENQKFLTIDFEAPLVNGKDYELIIRGLTDRSGNEIDTVTQTIKFFEARSVLPKDIVINELFADPSPAIGLPEGEFIELFNRSENAIDLSGWHVTDGSTTTMLVNKIILPGHYLILCQSSFANSFSALGNTMGLTTLPSLNNTGDVIRISNSQGVTIDSINYHFSWYHDDDKNDGGWSIERTNPNDLCAEAENWTASTNESGGTPGQINSVFALTEDRLSPEILTVAIAETDSLTIFFSERLSKGAISSNNFVIDQAIGFSTIGFSDNTLRTIGINLTNPIDSLLTYHITVSKIEDCPGNAIQQAVIKFRLDNTAPKVQSVITKNDFQLEVQFSEKIKTDLDISDKFYFESVHPENVISLNPYSVELTFSEKFINGKRYTLGIYGVEDLSGNRNDSSEHVVMLFKAFPVSHKDVIITEILADPTPVQGLPETEFIEILNRSSNPVQLENWTLSDESHEVKIKSHILLAGEYLVLTTSSKAFQFQNTLGVSSFPTLTNAGEPLVLRDSLGTVIDSVFYSDSWYSDSEKADGGWSLELIDPNNTCAENENWTASEDTMGGTPGKVNSVIAEKPDLTSPKIVSVFAASADLLIVSFDEKLHKDLPSVEHFSISPSVGVERVLFGDESKRSYAIKLSSFLENRVHYSISISNVLDCAGNTIEPHDPIFFALPEISEVADVVVNEVLFNPRPTGVDFVELYNRSEKYFNLKNWSVANLVNDTIVNRKKITENDLVFAPDDFLVLTSDPNVLKGEYLQSLEEKMLKTTLPTLSDDEGSVLILDESDRVIDTVFYSDDQHSPLLKNTEGISLERIDVNSPSSNKSNWQSASATSGYATPGFQNGSALQNIFEEAISIEPEIFSPTSGQPDFAMIAYTMDHAGYVANVKIVNQQGRVIKTVAENELLGADGFFTWRGDTAQGGKATIGAYMVWFEAFDQNGNVVTLKKRVVIAEPF